MKLRLIQVATLETPTDAANVAYGLRKRIVDRCCKSVHVVGKTVVIDYSRPRIARTLMLENDAFVDGYKIAKEFC